MTAVFDTKSLLVLTGDEMISDTYDLAEVEDGFFFEVEGNVSVIASADPGGQADSGQFTHTSAAAVDHCG